MLALAVNDFSRIRFETTPRPAVKREPAAWEELAYRRLAGAVLKQALLDLASSEPYICDNAVMWLLNEGAAWADVLGFSAAAVREFVINADMEKLAALAELDENQPTNKRGISK